MKRLNSSGQTLIILLAAVLLVAVFSVYLMKKLYSKQSEELQKNGLMESDINQVPTLSNAQNQVDSVRNQMNEIQNGYNKKLNDSMPNQ